ncbi:VOC family protein [Caulobacter sp. 1776]|uniref:VOC family protein n=1 Tax=Caulobacter sp. 1776 TaxID=3156420 RepID=UPI003391C072
MKPFLSIGLMLALSAAAPATAATAPPTTRLDHVLLWGRGIDEVTSIMAVKLGFQVRAGRDPGGVANRYVRFSDTSFIELLGVTRANPDYDPGMKDDRVALKEQPGARTFGFRSSDVDTIQASLKGLGYAVTPMFAGPDSQKPTWRLFAFDKAPLSSNTFYIDYKPDYAPDQADPSNKDDWRVTREHPNSVRALSAIWLVSGDPEADRAALARMGHGGAVPVSLPAVGAKGYCVPVGPTALLTLTPDGPGAAADTLAQGPRILGVSLAAADLPRAQRWVERGYETKLTRYVGLTGEAFLAPTQGDLGMLIEFTTTAKAGASPCGPLRK